MTRPGVYDPTGSLVPVLNEGLAQHAQVLIGWMTAFNAGNFTNTVDVLSTQLVNVPVLASAAATISVPCSVFMVKFGANYVVLGRLRVP